MHGSLYWFHRNDNLDARNFFDRAPVGKPEFKRNQFGGSVGGPIKSDHTFYFVNYEGLIERQGRSILTTVPDLDARQGILPGQPAKINITPAVRPYLDRIPFRTSPVLVAGWGRTSSDSSRRSIRVI